MIIHVTGDVVKLKGSLLENHWLALKSAVTLQLKRYPNGVVIDGSGLTDINEAGARTFLDVSNYIQSHGARIVVASLPDHILDEIRRIPGARSQLPITESVEAARASLAVGEGAAALDAKHKPAILVPLVGDWRTALRYAAAQAGRKTDVNLLYILQVPRSMPIGEPLPEQEREAQQMLAEAENVIKGLGMTAKGLTTRSRSLIEGVGRFASETSPKLVLVCYSKADLVREHSLYAVMGGLCHETTSDLIVVCTGAGEEGAPEPTGRPTVLLPLIGAWPRAIEVTATHASANRAGIDLLHVLQVPRTLSLQSSLPELEQEAEQALSEAERSARRYGVPISKHTIRSRGLYEGVARFAAQTRPILLVVSHFKSELRDQDSRYAGIASLCQETPCDVAVVCLHS